MTGRFPIVVTLVVLAVLMPSCKWVSSIVHDGEVVAKIGEHKLYRSDLEGVVPKGASAEDSTNLALMFIDSWAKDMAFLDIAESELSKEELDVEKELEQYRQTLLRYRYEQRYVNERLDTTVTNDDIQEYYDAHKDLFILERPVVKARVLNIARNSSSLPVMKKLMSSDNVDDVMAADSMAFRSSLNYHDFSAGWIDIVQLAAEFGTDYVTMLSKKKGSMVEMASGDDRVSVAFIAEMVNAGQAAPLEYCRERIKDIIISGRKHALLSTLEQDLIEDAKSKENFVIYSK